MVCYVQHLHSLVQIPAETGLDVEVHVLHSAGRVADHGAGVEGRRLAAVHAPVEVVLHAVLQLQDAAVVGVRLRAEVTPEVAYSKYTDVAEWAVCITTESPPENIRFVSNLM